MALCTPSPSTQASSTGLPLGCALAGDLGNVHFAGLDGIEDQGSVHAAGLHGFEDLGKVHAAGLGGSEDQGFVLMPRALN